MRKYGRKNNKIILVLIIAFTLFIGYAVLSKTIDIKGFAGFKKNTWKIVWDADSVEVTSGSTVDVTPIVNEEKNTVTYTAELSLPGDFYEFTVDAVNEGSIDGVLSVNSLIPIVIDENGETINLPEGLIYTIKYADGGELKKNHLLKTGEREKYRIRIEYDKDAENALDEQQISIETKVPYEQTNKDAIDRDTEKYTITFNPNGGDVDEATKKVVMELPIGKLPTPTRMGYLFDGWYTELEEGTKIDENTIPDGNLTYYAHWTERVSTFDTGQNVNAKIKKLAGNTLPETRPYSVNDTSITSFERSNTAPDISQMTEDNIISSDDSENPIYAWFDNGTIYWWSEANSADLNADSSYLFNGMKSLANLSLDNLYSSSVTTLQGAFGGVGLTSLDLTKLDTSNVTNMGSMFSGTSFEILDLSKLDTSRVTNMSGMFSNADLNNIDLTKLDISNVTNMTAMFNWSKKTSFDLRSWDTSNVADMTAMFASTTTTSINISGWNASKVTDMTTMFSSTTATSIDLSGMNASKVTNMTAMFSGCIGLTEIDLSDINTSNVTNMNGLVSGCTNLKTLNLSNWDFRKYNFGTGGCMINIITTTPVETLILDNAILHSDMKNGIANLSSVKSISMKNIDTSNVTNMYYMFGGDSSLTSIELSDFDTSNVTDMTAMFLNCSSLTEIDLSSFNTSKVTSIGSMFNGCSGLTELDLSSFDVRKVNNEMNAVVYNCSSLEKLDLSNWDLSNYTRTGWMANLTGGGSNSIKLLIVDNVIFAQNMTLAFSSLSSVEEISFKNVNTSNVTNMGSFFLNCSNLKTLDLSDFDTRNVTNMYDLFYNCSSLTELDLSSFDTRNVTNMTCMFWGCSGLEELDLSTFNISSLKYISSAFDECTSLKELNISNWNFATLGASAFAPSSSLGSDSLNTIIADNVVLSEYAGSMFNGTKVKHISLRNVNAASTTNLAAMFYNSSVESIDLDLKNTSNVNDMSSMFCGCTNLSAIDISSINTQNVTGMSDMFKGCTNLLLINMNGINTANVTNMEGMFSNCSHLVNLDVSGFNTSSVTNMSKMFSGCSYLVELDLSNFNTTSVEISKEMFKDCINLITIYSTNDLSGLAAADSSNMFTGSVKLVGGAGTVYGSNNVDRLYAHVDGGNSNPGYFTEKGKVSIIYNANGGTGSMSTQRVNSAVSNTLSSNTFTREHYVFTGWNTSSNGSGTPYGNGATIPANTINKYLNLYAQWALNGWIFVNESTSASLEDQQWSYYNTGIRIENGFHVLPDTYGDSRLYYIVDGIAQLGWVKDSNDNWFYFSKSDADGNGYVDCGAYTNGTYEIDGVNYTFDENGICINPFNNTGHYINSNQSAMRQKDIDLIKKYFSGYIY